MVGFLWVRLPAKQRHIPNCCFPCKPWNSQPPDCTGARSFPYPDTLRHCFFLCFFPSRKGELIACGGVSSAPQEALLTSWVSNKGRWWVRISNATVNKKYVNLPAPSEAFKTSKMQNKIIYKLASLTIFKYWDVKKKKNLLLFCYQMHGFQFLRQLWKRKKEDLLFKIPTL